MFGVINDGVSALSWLAQPASDVASERAPMAGSSTWVNGKPLTGRLTVRDASGQVVTREQYAQGVRHGLSIRWDERGHLVSALLYAYGERSGRHQAWWPDGTRRFDFYFANGLLEGVAREWHANGNLAREMSFRKGREWGVQRGWRASGESEFAYDMQGERRFAVMPPTPCPSLGHRTVRRAVGAAAQAAVAPAA